MMRGAVVAHQTCAIQTDDHVQLLQRHVVNHLVVGALHEAGVYVAEGHHALCRQSGRKGHGMLFRNAHVESPVRHLLHHDVERTAGRHGGGDAHNAVVPLGQLHDSAAEDLLIFQRLVHGQLFDLLTCFGVVFSGGVVHHGVLFGRTHPLPFRRHDVQQTGTFQVFQLPQHFDQPFDVVPVHRTEVSET